MYFNKKKQKAKDVERAGNVALSKKMERRLLFKNGGMFF